MAVNNILPFCPTDTGTNLLTQGNYAAASDRTNGNQPGIASAKLVNKATRQATFIASQIAEYISFKTGNDVLDDGDLTKLLAVTKSAILPLQPVTTRYTTGSGTHNATYYFFIASGSATAAATYTNNGFTFTVKSTIAAGLVLEASGTGVPSVSGTLTKASGTGDATLTFYSVRAPLNMIVKMVGGGSGGAGGGSPGTYGAGGTGGSTTFGTSLLTAGGGTSAVLSSTGGTVTINSPAINIQSVVGSFNVLTAVSNTIATYAIGTTGGVNPLSNRSGPGQANTTGYAADANSGCGGGGGSTNSTVTGSEKYGGPGGGSGGYIEALIPTPSATYAYAIGAGGTAGTAGTAGFAGGAGGSGLIVVAEQYQ